MKKALAILLSVLLLMSAVPLGVLPALSVSAAQVAAINTDITVTITSSGQSVDLVFVPPASGYYTFYSDSSRDTYGYILNANRSTLRSDDDSGDGNNFRMEYYFAAGNTYYLRSRFYSSGYTGSFTVRIDGYVPPHDHLYSAPCDAICNICGAVREADDHIYDDAADLMCNVCGSAYFLTYTISNNEVIIDGYAADVPNDLVIPGTIEGYPVTTIGSYAFNGCSSLTSVTIPDSVTTIGSYAFDSCSSLTSVIIPDSVTAIGSDAFDACSSLTSVTIPDSVITIGSYAFDGCSSLTSVTIPDSVTSIGNYAFRDCSSLTSVHISDVAAWCDISFGNVYANPMCENAGLYLNGSRVLHLEIPEGVTAIRDYAFYNCDSLWSVTIPDSVTSIGSYAFYDCYYLQSVTIPDSVTSVGNYAFAQCPNLKEAHLGNGITAISNYMFYNCDSLTSIAIPDSVTSIRSYAFFDCDSLQSVMMGDSVTSIGYEAFYSCETLMYLSLPASVTTIESYAFYYCNQLRDIYYGGTQDDRWNITIYGSNNRLNSAIWYYEACFHQYDDVCDADCSACGAVREPEHLYDADCNDADCNLCGVVRDVPTHTYDNSYDAECNLCGAIRTIESIQTDEDIRIYITESYEQVTLPFVPQKSGYYRFVFSTSDASCYLYTDYDGIHDLNWGDSAMEVYLTAGRSYYLDVGYRYGDIGSFVLHITYSPQPYFRYAYTVTNQQATITGWQGTLPSELVIPDTIDGYPVTAIAKRAFQDCNQLRSVIIPEGVTSIGYRAFQNCDSLSSITLPASLTALGYSAFSSCYSLTDINYVGDETARWNIHVGEYNERFYEANWHYNYCFHEYDDNCDTDCNLCGDVRVAPHTYTNACDGECNFCGAVREYSHVYNNCNDADCNVCGEMREPGHIYDNGCDTACNRCGAVRSARHIYGNACDEYCDVCGEWRAITHSYDDCLDSACNVCGAVRETPAHTYDSDCDAFCNLCNILREVDYISVNTNTTVTIATPGQNVDLLFVPTTSGYYTFGSYNGRGIDTYGYVLDSNGDQLYSNDDQGDYYNFLISCYLTAGETYVLRSRYYSSSYTGSLIVRICYQDSGYRYYIDGDKAVITGYDDECPSRLVIPDTIEGYPVTAIAKRAFQDCYNLRSVIIPEGVTYIGYRAFQNCDSLSSITLPESLIEIDYSAFESCYWLFDVYYAGDQQDRWNMNIGEYNDMLYEASWHYNVCLHEYDNACDDTCNNCGEVRDDAHAYLNVCDRDCNLCGLVRQAPHDYDGVCDNTCNTCGAQRKAEAHTYNNACDDTCNGCGLIRRVPSHVYDSVCDEICNECGFIRNENIHVYDNICDADCNLCGALRDVAPHIYSGVCDPDCNRCGTLRETPAHVYSDACDFDCNLCGAMRTPPHAYTDDEDNECNVCGHLRTPATLPDDMPLFVVDNAEAKAGETFTVAIRTENNPGIISAKLSVYYDTWLLDLVDYCEVDFADVSYGPHWNHPFVVNWYNAVQPNNQTNGTVVLLTFRVNDWAAAGSTATIWVDYDYSDVFNSDWESVWFETISGTVTVLETTYGDVNGDGDINNRDLALMQQYINGWDVDVSIAACDVNRDGDINNRDLALFQQYLNGWGVTLG